jgi:opacity protein-like surface antigen
MMGKGFLRAAAFAALFTGLATAASAQITVSGGFAVSSAEVKGQRDLNSEVGLGGNVFVDYLLPISIPLSLGFEFGYDTTTLSSTFSYGDGYGNYTSGEFTITGSAIPLLLRAAYHFDLMANLDLYVVGKVGYVLGSAKQDDDGYSSTIDDINGVGFGFDVGAAYYFNSRIGIFAEAGFERYSLEKEESGFKVEVPFSRFIIVGISAKF